MKLERNTWRTLRTLKLLSLALFAMAACGPAELGVVLSDGHDFEGGEPVTRNGVKIGVVKSLVLENSKPTLITEIERDRFDEFRDGLKVEIKTPTFGLGSREVIITSLGDGERLSSGVRVAGHTPAEGVVKSAGNLASEALKAAKKMKEEVQKLEESSNKE